MVREEKMEFGITIQRVIRSGDVLSLYLSCIIIVMGALVLVFVFVSFRLFDTVEMKQQHSCNRRLFRDRI